jgi:hypothetical protein
MTFGNIEERRSVFGTDLRNNAFKKLKRHPSDFGRNCTKSGKILSPLWVSESANLAYDIALAIEPHEGWAAIL